MKKIKFTIVGAQGHANKLTTEHNSLYVVLESNVGLNKEAIGSVFEMLVLNEDDNSRDIINFVAEDIKYSKYKDGNHYCIALFKAVIPESDKMILINRMVGIDIYLDPYYLIS